MRLSNKLTGNRLQLRDPFLNKLSLRILIDYLRDGRIDSNGVNPCGASLHLYLTKMDSRLKIQKMLCQKKSGLSPMKP